MGDNKNFILFAVLSLAFFMGYEYFVLGPKMQRAQEAQQAQVAQQAETGAADKATAGDQITPPDSSVPVSTPKAKAPVLADVGHVSVDTPELKGSINLRGATFDDIILSNFTTSLDKDSKKVRLLSSETKADGYYARFGWVAPAGTSAGAMPTDTSVWTADHDTLTPDQPVTLAWDNGQGTRFLMKVSVDDKFMFTVDQSVINTSGAAMKVAPYGIIMRKGEPKTSGLYILHEGPMSVFDGIYEEKTYKDLTKDGDFETKGTDGTGGWIGITDKYWMATLIPDPKSKVARARMERNTGSNDAVSYDVNFVQDWKDVPAGQTVETTNHLYAGAKIVKVIDAYKAKYGITDFDKAVDWGYFWFFTKPIFHGLHWLFQLTGNYGVAIILMTMILKLLLFPLASKSYRSMSHMKRAQPKIKAIQERYKDDKQRQQQEMMALYKSEKINPAAGCLPMIPQTFVFFALYKTLYVTIEMRHQPFFGWIHDLSAPDHMTILNFFGLIPWTPPTAIAIGVLPMLMGITMYLQQKMNPQSAQMDPTQAKVMSFLPLVFTFIMARFSAGLVLYWTCNNTLSILQQWVIMRREDARLSRASASKASS